MRTKMILILLALLLASFTVIQAQDATPEATPEATTEGSMDASTDASALEAGSVICDADLILNLYIAERYLGFGAIRDQLMAADGTMEMVDMTVLDYGQYTPLFDAMMMSPAESPMSDAEMSTVTGMLMMDAESMMSHMEMMMPDMDMSSMTALEWADVEGEDEVCSNLRAELRHFNTVLAYQDMMGCGTDTGSASGTGDVVNFSTTLSGGTEVPGPGDEDGTGTAAVTVDMPNGQICYTFNVQNITLPAAAAHIHRGEAGVGGDVVVPFDNAPDASGTSTGCVFVEADLLSEIAANPASFYVNVHTEDFPGGAIRGQVNGGVAAPVPSTDATAEATSDEAAAPAPTEVVSMPTLSASLAGAAEVPGPGDDDGAGTATVTFDMAASQICYTFSVQNLTLPAAAAHIHRGEAGVSGDVVVPFDTAPDANGASSGCVTVDAALMTEITTNPAGFYVNVHTSDFPDGAVRGQLG